MKNKAALTSELARLKVAAKVSRNEDLLSKTSAQSEWCSIAYPRLEDASSIGFTHHESTYV